MEMKEREEIRGAPGKAGGGGGGKPGAMCSSELISATNDSAKKSKIQGKSIEARKVRSLRGKIETHGGASKARSVLNFGKDPAGGGLGNLTKEIRAGLHTIPKNASTGQREVGREKRGERERGNGMAVG